MNKYFLRRIVSYILGNFVLALGVSLAVKSGLGVSPNTSLPLSLSLLTGLDLGFWSAMVFIFFVALQLLILKKDFKPIQFLQVVTSMLFGYFVTLATKATAFIPPPSGLALGLVCCIFGIILVALGVFLYFSADIMPMSPEGLAAAFAKKINRPMPTAKLIVDCTMVAVAAAITRIFYGSFEGFGIGTLLAALLVSRVLAIFIKLFGKGYRAFLFGK